MDQTEENTRDRLRQQAGPTTLTVRYGLEPDQVFEQFGNPTRPAAVLIHGGWWRPDIDRTTARPAARALAHAGLHVFLPEYRRTPGHPDHTLHDLAALHTHLLLHGVTPDVIIGHSAGGHLALLTGAGNGPHGPAVIALAPVADILLSDQEGHGHHAARTWIGTTPDQDPDQWHRLNPAALLPARPTAPVWVFHGDHDTDVPLPVSAHFDRAILPGAHHFDPIDPDSTHFPPITHVILAAATAHRTTHLPHATLHP